MSSLLTKEGNKRQWTIWQTIENTAKASPTHFNVIVDEAHSSQSGESTKSLKAVLASVSLEEAEREEAASQSPEEELESTVLAEMESRGRLPNLSTFAFTATPKSKTLELFGTKRPDGKFAPDSLTFGLKKGDFGDDYIFEDGDFVSVP